MEFTFAEMFSGIGGFRLGLEKAKLAIGTSPQQGNGSLQGGCNAQPKNSPSTFTCVWANDNNRAACKIYHHRFGYKELVEADIKTVNTNSIPDHMLLTAGFPCQAFSVAGKRKGFRDTRGPLFHEICRVAKAKKPPLLLLENVKGLLSHDEGLTFQIIIESLEELGYFVEWQVLNSKHFGVPQNRERVFIIGHLRGTGSRQIFPIGESNKVSDGKIEKAQISSALLQTYYKSGIGDGHTLIHNIYGGFKEGMRVSDKISPTIRTPKGGGHLPMVVQPCLTLDRAKKRQHGRRFKQNGESMFTLTGQDIHGIKEGMRIRRLTPVECERLQGFPDGWTRGVSDTQRYKLLGNAVTVNVIKYLGMKLLDYVCLKKSESNRVG